jgi:hypothetical protein
LRRAARIVAEGRRADEKMDMEPDSLDRPVRSDEDLHRNVEVFQRWVKVCQTKSVVDVENGYELTV